MFYQITCNTNIYNPFPFSTHPPPAFGSSPNLEALALHTIKSEAQDGDSDLNAGARSPR